MNVLNTKSDVGKSIEFAELIKKRHSQNSRMLTNTSSDTPLFIRKMASLKPKNRTVPQFENVVVPEISQIPGIYKSPSFTSKSDESSMQSIQSMRLNSLETQIDDKPKLSSIMKNVVGLVLGLIESTIISTFGYTRLEGFSKKLMKNEEFFNLGYELYLQYSNKPQSELSLETRFLLICGTSLITVLMPGMENILSMLNINKEAKVEMPQEKTDKQIKINHQKEDEDIFDE